MAITWIPHLPWGQAHVHMHMEKSPRISFYGLTQHIIGYMPICDYFFHTYILFVAYHQNLFLVILFNENLLNPISIFTGEAVLIECI